MLIATDGLRALPWKNERVIERENKEEDIFLSYGLTWMVVTKTNGTNKDLTRIKRNTVDEIKEDTMKGLNEKNSHEEGDHDVDDNDSEA